MSSSTENKDGGHQTNEQGSEVVQNDLSGMSNLEEELPPYQAVASSQNAITHTGMPTISAPFDFPVGAPPPNYSSITTNRRPIAIPQRFPDPAAPFLSAYSPVLLNHGIPSDTWYSFLDTLSAFLTAKVSKRAISHAADIASTVVKMPQRFGKSVVDNAKSHTKEITMHARRGNVGGVINSVVGGIVGMTVGTATGLVGHVLSTPGNAAIVASSPQTPRARAGSYAAAANKKWLQQRGLHAQLFSTFELCTLIDVSVQQFLGTVNGSNNTSTDPLSDLKDCLEALQLKEAMANFAVSPPLPSTSFDGNMAEKNQGHQAKFSAANSGSNSKSGTLETGNDVVESSSSSAVASTLKVTAETLWLVLIRQ
jgi:hypothetical protein